MRLIDDLLNDDHYDEQPAAQEAQSNPNSAPPADDVSDGSELNAHGRRGRSSSVSDDPEELRQGRRAWMEATMDELSIRGTDREYGRHFADLEFTRQIMYLFAYQLAQRSQINNLAAAEFLRSDVYENHVVNRLKVAVLFPGLCNYVTLFNEAVVANIPVARESWRVPDDIIQHPEQWRRFSSEVKTKLTQIKSQNKGVLYRLRDRGADINEIMRALAPQGMVIREHHRARAAWISLATVEFDELCEERKQKPSKFWDWMGSELLALKKTIATDQQYTTDLQRRTAMARVFTRALAKHREQFPPLTPVDPPQTRPGWQESVEDALNLGFGI